MTNEKVMSSLLLYEISKAPVDLEALKSVSNDDLKRVIEIARKHSIDHLISHALLSLEIVKDNSELFEECVESKNFALACFAQFDYVLSELKMLFEQNNIQFIPLKGSVIRNYYLEPWMRSSGDIDILVKKEDLRTISNLVTDELDFKFKFKGSHDISFTKGNVSVEFHFDLIEEGRANKSKEVLKDVWDYCFPVEHSAEYRMSNECMYFYLIAHFAKHFEESGCGIRFLCDMWIIKRNVHIDNEKLNSFLADANLTKFAFVTEKAARVVFEDEKSDKLTDDLIKHIVNGGVYGCKETRIAISSSKKRNDFFYWISRVFPNYKVMKKVFPKLDGKKVLLPMFWIKRFFIVTFTKQRRFNLKDEVKMKKTITKESMLEINKLLTDIGLKRQ